jgi:hypothetical protein
MGAHSERPRKRRQSGVVDVGGSPAIGRCTSMLGDREALNNSGERRGLANWNKLQASFSLGLQYAEKQDLRFAQGIS